MTRITRSPASSYYEDQKEPAKARTAAFLANRVPKYFGYFERALQQNPHGPAHIFGPSLTYVDLSLFQLVEGLRYAFPRAMRGYANDYPALAKLSRRGAPAAAYCRLSEIGAPARLQRVGIFRHYPELDQAPR